MSFSLPFVAQRPSQRLKDPDPVSVCVCVCADWEPRLQYKRTSSPQVQSRLTGVFVRDSHFILHLSASGNKRFGLFRYFQSLKRCVFENACLVHI